MFYNIITLTIKLFFTLRRTVVFSQLSHTPIPQPLIIQLFQPLHPQNSLPKFTHQKTSIFLVKSTKYRTNSKTQYNTIIRLHFVGLLIMKTLVNKDFFQHTPYFLPNT